MKFINDVESHSIVKLKSLATSEANYLKFSDRDVREDILGPTLYLAEPINAFAVALCDNIRRIRDVAEKTACDLTREKKRYRKRRKFRIIRYSLHTAKDSHYMKRNDK